MVEGAAQLCEPWGVPLRAKRHGGRSACAHTDTCLHIADVAVDLVECVDVNVDVDVGVDVG
eukprot:8177193-Pyramimonas_sp.AAC.1